MLLEKTNVTIAGSSSVISFAVDGDAQRPNWDRYITIDGKKAFHIGNHCGSCAFFFERLEGANRSVNPVEVARELNDGIGKLDPILIEKLQKIFPDGRYLVSLSEVNPSLVKPGSEGDYFSHEQIDLWGLDRFWGMPHSPRTEYYRLQTKGMDNGDKGFFEFLIPTFPSSWLKESRVQEYCELIKGGRRPTIVALSVLDIKGGEHSERPGGIASHWCLSNYLIDGHHKAFAAAGLRKPITMISFLAQEHGVSSVEEINAMLAWL